MGVWERASQTEKREEGMALRWELDGDGGSRPGSWGAGRGKSRLSPSDSEEKGQGAGFMQAWEKLAHCEACHSRNCP